MAAATTIIDDITTQESVTIGVHDARYTASLQRAHDIRAAFAFITLIMATVGNTLSFIIMRRKPMKATSAGVFFSYIAIADTATVYVGQLLFLIGYIWNLFLIIYHPWSCRWLFFLLFTFADFAVWLLVAATVDRFIAITFPLKVKTMCTPKRAHAVAISFLIAAVMKNLHLFWTRGKQVITDADGLQTTINCGFPSPGIQRFEHFIRPWIGFTLYAFLPISAVFVLNIVISYKLYRLAKDRPGGTNSKPPGEKNSTQLTAMLLSIAVVFLVLIIPSITVLVARPYVVKTLQDEILIAYVEAVVDSMAYLNHSINFILYCLTGTGFRHQAKKLLCFWRHNQVGPDENSITQK